MSHNIAIERNIDGNGQEEIPSGDAVKECIGEDGKGMGEFKL